MPFSTPSEAFNWMPGGSAPVTMLTENQDFYQTFTLNYHGGEKYPILVRDSSKPDLLDEIIKPLTPEPDALKR